MERVRHLSSEQWLLAAGVVLCATAACYVLIRFRRERATEDNDRRESFSIGSGRLAFFHQLIVWLRVQAGVWQTRTAFVDPSEIPPLALARCREIVGGSLGRFLNVPGPTRHEVDSVLELAKLHRVVGRIPVRCSATELYWSYDPEGQELLRAVADGRITEEMLKEPEMARTM